MKVNKVWASRKVQESMKSSQVDEQTDDVPNTRLVSTALGSI